MTLGELIKILNDWNLHNHIDWEIEDGNRSCSSQSTDISIDENYDSSKR